MSALGPFSTAFFFCAGTAIICCERQFCLERWRAGLRASVGLAACQSRVSENTRNRHEAIKKAKKDAVTDARKRALRVFGNGLGNCVRDKVFLIIHTFCAAANAAADADADADADAVAAARRTMRAT